ncbi:Uncharacterised protein [Mycobacteroides abscessus subsp. abscessus]|nr:Uncharacterised protein [Mycobacteroides abscessus subsp. abscessus]
MFEEPSDSSQQDRVAPADIGSQDKSGERIYREVLGAVGLDGGRDIAEAIGQRCCGCGEFIQIRTGSRWAQGQLVTQPQAEMFEERADIRQCDVFGGPRDNRAYGAILRAVQELGTHGLLRCARQAFGDVLDVRRVWQYRRLDSCHGALRISFAVASVWRLRRASHISKKAMTSI